MIFNNKPQAYEAPVFPSIRNEIKKHPEGFVGFFCKTSLRKKGHDGMWYHCTIVDKCDYSLDETVRIKFIEQFYSNVYRMIIAGLVDRKAYYFSAGDEEPPTQVWMVDHFQEEEDERLFNVMIGKKSK